MAWLRSDDGADEDPAILAIARTQREADLILGIHTALKLYCAKHLTDGFLPELKVRRHLRGRLLAAFCDPDAAEPLLHTRGADCECLEGRTWPHGMTYALHHYLKSNPTREEYDVQRAKAAELRDRELCAAVRRRDRDSCRYCARHTVYADRRSGLGLVFDHIDPTVAEGAANLVVACRSCNSRKGNRTPAAAGMTLLPPPDDDQLVGAGSRSRQTTGSTSWSPPDPTTHAPARDGTGRVPAPAAVAGNGGGPAGEAGIRPATGPPAGNPRSSADPNPYHRRAITGADPADHPGLPDDPGPPSLEEDTC